MLVCITLSTDMLPRFHWQLQGHHSGRLVRQKKFRGQAYNLRNHHRISNPDPIPMDEAKGRNTGKLQPARQLQRHAQAPGACLDGACAERIGSPEADQIRFFHQNYARDCQRRWLDPLIEKNIGIRIIL